MSFKVQKIFKAHVRLTDNGSTVESVKSNSISTMTRSTKDPIGRGTE